MLKGSSDQEKLDDLCKKNYKEQAIWYLNAFWKKLGEKEAINIWNFKTKYDSLDPQGAEGCQLDELNAHRFLEANKETLTVAALRQKLAEAGVDKNSKRKYKDNLHTLVTASQGDNQDEIDQAQRMLDQVSKAFEEVQAAEAAAKQRAEEAKVAEAAARAAQSELEASLAELKAQEDAFNNKTNELKKKSETGSTVQQNKAKNELAQHLSSDPLPLRKAKTTNEAAVRKAERTTKAAQAATAASEQAREAAEQAVIEAQEQVRKAEAFLEEVKSKPGSAQGQLWFMSHELEEKKKYLPKSKGGVERK